jgi:alkaline phosphatase isozyme conversion protein
VSVPFLFAVLTISLQGAALGFVQDSPRDPGFGAVAREHIGELSDRIGARVAGSPGEVWAAGYIENVFSQIGYPTRVQPFSFTGGPRGRRSTRESANVIAVKAGSSNEEIIVGAHYDSEVRGRGAGDNASGVGVMLEIAATIRDVVTPYTIRFIAFGAEEEGLAGSRYMVSEIPPEDIVRVVAMINLDSLIAGDFAYVYGDRGDRGVVRDWVLARAREQGLDLRTQPGENPEYPMGTTGEFSDHASFEDVGIQYAYFESTNWSLGERDGYVQVDPQLGENGYIWHTPFDTMGYIESTFPGRIDARLHLFATMLYQVLTEFSAP